VPDETYVLACESHFKLWTSLKVKPEFVEAANWISTNIFHMNANVQRLTDDKAELASKRWAGHYPGACINMVVEVEFVMLTEENPLIGAEGVRDGCDHTEDRIDLSLE